MKTNIIFFLFFIFLYIISCKGENIGYYIPLKAKQPPKIDGNLTEAEWKKAKKIEFIKMDGKNPLQKTNVRILYDDKSLYFGIECFEDMINRIKKNFTKRDDPVWGDDCIEIFIAPDYLKRNKYFHFVFNSIGIQFDQKVDISGANSEWNGKWTVKTKILEDKWVGEVSIPFSDIGVNDGDLNLLGVSVCRERKPVVENTVWAVGGWFHKPDGHLLFTTYKEYVRKKILPFWKKEKEEILKMVKEYGGKNKRKVNKIKEIILQIEKENKDFFEKEITSERINSFIEDLRRY